MTVALSPPAAPDLGVVFCSHRTADVSVRERLGFSRDRLTEVYGSLRERFPGWELVVLSTCNRVEVYSAAPPRVPAEGGAAPFAPRLSELSGFLSEFHAVPRDAFAGSLLERRGPDAVRHLFSVCAGVDSLVLGESQIVAQVKDAYEVARGAEACGPLTHARSFRGPSAPPPG